ncbi:LPS export ABC transporter periplasmic protein LptC [Oxalobacter paraformigenes]|uniref:LPS export ABC transporter periplasmic protein LptC n=1 Tax=Oxalobacter paraformigenes TaxID=556268 RepID=C3X4U0_9BURK|nr:LPS export ABC transporter periplasmic protein LptC [Oxalobacter paraformigenes]EEO28226.1 hypothetical protein OFAG_01379 [Oxalobacter paraformigenes]
MIYGPKSALRVRLTIVFVVVLILTLGSMWLNMVIRKTATDAAALAQRTEPDFIVENFRYFKMKPDGQAQYEAIGTKMTHFPIEDSYLIDNPVIFSLNNDSQLQTIKSKEAYVEDFNSKIHMRNDVVMNREPSATKGPFKLTSEYVLVYPDDEIMTSDREVIVHDNHSVMTGVGMQANNATSELQIFNRARITYQPPGKSNP